MQHKPFVLTILDGFGHSNEIEHNAIAQAHTPFLDKLLAEYPNTLIDCQGKSVGLPQGQIGNSEVGHMHIGAGRVIPQALTKISQALSSATTETFSLLQVPHGAIHLLGLLSDGGVHSHIDHFCKMIEILQSHQRPIYLHAFLDGRDTAPQSAKQHLELITNRYKHQVEIASICGRYYAMDRDQNWERTKLAYDMLYGQAPYKSNSALDALESGYTRGETDEFIQPTICSNKDVSLGDSDTIIFMNFRADRARQLSHALADNNFTKFPRQLSPKKELITLTEYTPDLRAKVLFPNELPKDTLGQVISNAGLSQLRIAETEKYAHVTYFFNGGNEKNYRDEERIMIPSPKVATYDQKPEMSATELTDTIIRNLDTFKVIICNYANADMVGHTGNLNATITAIETIDSCLMRIHQRLQELEGTMLITADHGNAESMYNRNVQQPHTAHTNNLVPCILTNKQATLTRTTGSLIDIAPSVLALLGISIPSAMTGSPLFSCE